MQVFAVAAAVALASSSLSGRRDAGAVGLTQVVWGNSAGAGPVNITSIVQAAQGQWPPSSSSDAGARDASVADRLTRRIPEQLNPSNGAVSVEFSGTLHPPASGPTTFACNVTGGTVVMWLDDHIICGE